jgi:phage-related protein (TIGR01555 family)
MFSKAIELLNVLTGAGAAPRLDSIQNAVTGLGTAEDQATYGKPTAGRRLTDAELMILYATSDLAQRIVDEIVDDAMRQGYVPRDAETNEEIEQPDHLDIERTIAETLKEARLLGGAAIFMVTKGDSDFSKPLDPTKGHEIESLIILDRTELSVGTRDYNVRSPRFGQAETYTVTPRGSVGVYTQTVHASRLLVFHGQRLPRFLRYTNDDWNDSVLQACWDRIRNFEQTELAMGNIVQRFEIATYSIDGLGEILESPDGREKILNRLQLIQRTISMVRAVVLDKEAGESYTRSFTSVNGLDTIWDRLAHSVAKGARMSMTQLFGAAPSGLATDDESGRANWRKQIKTVHTRDLEPALKRYYQLLNDGRPVQIVFAALDEATATEEASIAKTNAEMREIYVRMGAAVPNEFREHLMREGIVVSVEMEESTDEGDPDGDLGDNQAEEGAEDGDEDAGDDLFEE